MLGVLRVVGDSSTKLVLPATNELIWGTVAFLLFMVVLWRAGVWRRLGEAMDERTRRIRSDLENAEAARKEGERLLEQYRQQLAEARAQAREIMEDAKRRADQTRQELMAKAERDAENARHRAEEEIRAEIARARQDLRRDVGRLAVQIAERVVGDSLNGDRQLRLVDDYIDEIDRQSGGGSGAA